MTLFILWAMWVNNIDLIVRNDIHTIAVHRLLLDSSNASQLVLTYLSIIQQPLDEEVELALYAES